MPIGWKLFKAICIVQTLAASILGIMTIIRMINEGNLFNLIGLLLYLLIFLETILAINILNNNYPDIPVVGRQKTNFNRLFLLNFLFLAFLFGNIFAEFRAIRDIARIIDKPLTRLPFAIYLTILMECMILLFQFIILYGLYLLRRELYDNFMKRQFEFEKDHRV